MAENKKAFILYCDLISVVEKLPNETAGKLFKIILEYVNDKNPTVSNLILQIAFEPIKQQLKRDLVRYEEFKVKQSENGKLGGRPKTQKNPKNPSLFSETQKSLTVTDTVTVINNKKNNAQDFVCYDAEEFILNNRPIFEKICIATGKQENEVKTFIHEYHLWMTKKENYPVGKKAVAAGAESWILNAKNFNKEHNGNKHSKSNTDVKLGTSEARIKALRNW